MKDDTIFRAEWELCSRLLIVLVVILLTAPISSNAQLPLPIFDKIKKIHLLESESKDVETLLADDSFEYSNAHDHYQTFWMYDSIVRVYYSSGTCGGDEWRGNDWDVPEGKVVQIDVSPKSSYPITQLRVDLSKLKRERTDWHRKGFYVYFDRSQEAAFFVTHDFIDTVKYTPARLQFEHLCKSPEILNFYRKNTWLRYPDFKKGIVDYDLPANVLDLTLTQSDQNRRQFNVATKAEDPENDVLTYRYKVTGGKIVGSGKAVIWDLSSVQLGTYSITAVADDGCGPCGQLISRSVHID
jgi:hypothetical protein